MNRILIIEDDTDINNMTAEALGKAGFDCTQAFSGTEGLRFVKERGYDVIIMDLMLPGMNGEVLLPEIRQHTAAPVIVISAKDGLDSKIDLLQSGADDYLTKPFAIDELVARVAVQLRRGGSGATPHPAPVEPPSPQGEGKNHGVPDNADKLSIDNTVLRYRDLTLDPSSYTAEIAGHPLALTRQEFRILELLLTHPKRAFSKQEIYDYAWDDIYIGEDKTINVHISNIRKKIRQYTEDEYIGTVWGIGFRLARG